MNASLTSSMLIFCAQRHSPNPAVPRAVQALNKQSSNETKMAASAGAHQAVLLQQLRQDFSTLSRMTTAHTFSPAPASPNAGAPLRPAGTMDSEAFQSSGDILDLKFQCELG